MKKIVESYKRKLAAEEGWVCKRGAQLRIALCYPNVYSIAFAGGGIQGGQVHGSSDSQGAFPRDNPCGPADVHATIFQSLGISPRALLRDMLGRPLPVSDGNVLPLF